MSIKLKSKSRKKKKNNSWLILLLITVLLLGGLGIAIHNLSKSASSYAAREAQLQALIAAEESKASRFEEEAKYRQTMRFIEQKARERLNLVFPGEVIVKPIE
ncbi:MAG: septum formation initiator family protein [Lachnospiraceae bacterium]|nr:septum formation initiator family protein [Lachnospiraceae bacterium]